MNANLFELNSDNVRITYSSQGNGGLPFLTYQDSDIDRTYSSSEIRLVQTEIAQLITITLSQGVDVGTTVFTILLPTVVVAQAGSTVVIKTKSIITTFPKPIGSDLPGPNEIYRVEALHGTAQFQFVKTDAPADAAEQVA